MKELRIKFTKLLVLQSMAEEEDEYETWKRAHAEEGRRRQPQQGETGADTGAGSPLNSPAGGSHRNSGGVGWATLKRKTGTVSTLYGTFSASGGLGEANVRQNSSYQTPPLCKYAVGVVDWCG